jgi:hypothetical protein
MMCPEPRLSILDAANALSAAPRPQPNNPRRTISKIVAPRDEFRD